MCRPMARETSSTSPRFVARWFRGLIFAIYADNDENATVLAGRTDQLVEDDPCNLHRKLTWKCSCDGTGGYEILEKHRRGPYAPLLQAQLGHAPRLLDDARQGFPKAIRIHMITCNSLYAL